MSRVGPGPKGPGPDAQGVERMPNERTKQDELIPVDDESMSPYDVEYLKECASGTAREERLAELRRRIHHGAYHVDAESIAEEMLRRGDLSDENA